MNDSKQPHTEPQTPNTDASDRPNEGVLAADESSPQPAQNTLSEPKSNHPINDNPTPIKATAHRSGFVAFTFILVMVLAAGTGYGGWWLWQQQHTLHSVHANQLERLSLQHNTFNQELQNVEQSLAMQQRTQSELTATLAALQAETIAIAQQQQGPASTNADGLLTDLEFLLRSARHIGLLTGDLARVETLLEQASQQLQAAQRLSLLPIREALSQDLQQLHSLPRTDFDALYLRLGALAQETQHWQWWPTERLHTNNEPTNDLAVSGWPAAWLELRSLIRLHERSEQRFETLDMASFEQARNQYRLFLLQAQAALLQGQQQAYQYSLEQALTWLDRFQEYVPQHVKLQAQVQAIMAESVVRQTPDIKRALERLQLLQSATGDGS